MKKILSALFLIGAALFARDARAASYYCDLLCRKSDGTYFQVRCMCRPDGSYYQCGSGCGGGMMILSTSPEGKKIISSGAVITGSAGAAAPSAAAKARVAQAEAGLDKARNELKSAEANVKAAEAKLADAKRELK